MPRGGKRAGSGRPVGSGPRIIEKALLREQVRALILPHIQPLIESQIANAKGLSYLVTRDKKNGKFIRVTEAMAKLKQEQTENEEIIEVWEKDPSVQAFTDLLNRLIDKPAEQEQQVEHTGTFVMRHVLD